MADPRVRRPNRAVVLTISLLFLALIGAGCTGGDDGDDDGRGGARNDQGRAMSVDVGIGNVAGSLATPRRRAVARQVGRVVDGWFERAYVGGDYPRTAFQNSYPRFTQDIRRQAWRDRKLTSNAGVGRRTQSVEPVRKRVRVDVVAWKGTPRTATARFVLVFDAEEEKRAVRHRVQGRLMLVRNQKQKWWVVGYDVRRSDRVTGGKR